MEKLIETIARAMFASDYRDLAAEWENLPDDLEEGKPEYYLLARAALAAIEASGTHRVVSLTPLPRPRTVDEELAEDERRALLAARPRITP